MNLRIINNICIAVVVCVLLVTLAVYDYKITYSKHTILHSLAKEDMTCDELLKFVKENL